MKAWLSILFLLVLSSPSLSQNEQTRAITETMANTFNMEGDKLSGSSFTVTKDKNQYFVTAAHLFNANHESGDVVPIQLLIQNQLHSFDAEVYFHSNRKVDIAVVKIPEKVSQTIKLQEEFTRYNELIQKVFKGNGISLDTTVIALGMEVFFYGFPSANMGTEVLAIKFPLVKKAIISGSVKYNGADVLLLDGRNKSGFSGGPVVAYDTVRKKMCIVGVLSGFFRETKDVEYKGDRIFVDENSGIVVCYGRNYIDDIFTKNKKLLR